jgi:hypothetical protein
MVCKNRSEILTSDFELVRRGIRLTNVLVGKPLLPHQLIRCRGDRNGWRGGQVHRQTVIHGLDPSPPCSDIEGLNLRWRIPTRSEARVFTDPTGATTEGRGIGKALILVIVFLEYSNWPGGLYPRRSLCWLLLFHWFVPHP